MTIDTDVAAYAAAIVDGEGSVTITEKGSGHKELRVEVQMTDPNVPNWLGEHFKGRVYKGEYKSGSLAFRWIVESKAAEEFLRIIRPYVRTKREVVEEALDYRRTYGESYSELPDHVVDRREVAVRRTSEINNRQLPSYDEEQHLALVEKFFSMQGEGKNRGRSAIFVRFAGCNLRCNFSDDPEEDPNMCDTPWFNTNEKTTVGEIMGWMQDTSPSNWKSPEDRPMVVLTGGEPTMAPGFNDLVYACKANGYYVAVETNGTIYKESFPFLDWTTVSPKEDVAQGNPVHGDPLPNWDPGVSDEVKEHMANHPGEYRYVITGPDAEKPPFYPARRHYLSPAVISDGSGELHYEGFPGFVDGAVERCTEIIQNDPRWRISFQSHKFVGAR